MVIRLHVLMQNYHVVPSIELLCLYLANSHNLTQYITVVIRLHLLMQKSNNHVVPSIELLCLYLANSHNLTHYITVVIRLHFLVQNHPSNYCAYTWPTVTILPIISPWLLGFASSRFFFFLVLRLWKRKKDECSLGRKKERKKEEQVDGESRT